MWVSFTPIREDLLHIFHTCMFDFSIFKTKKDVIRTATNDVPPSWELKPLNIINPLAAGNEI